MVFIYSFFKKKLYEKHHLSWILEEFEFDSDSTVRHTHQSGSWSLSIQVDLAVNSVLWHTLTVVCPAEHRGHWQGKGWLELALQLLDFTQMMEQIDCDLLPSYNTVFPRRSSSQYSVQRAAKALNTCLRFPCFVLFKLDDFLKTSSISKILWDVNLENFFPPISQPPLKKVINWAIVSETL